MMIGGERHPAQAAATAVVLASMTVGGLWASGSLAPEHLALVSVGYVQPIAIGAALFGAAESAVQVLVPVMRSIQTYRRRGKDGT